jgi:hypothetical protein
LAAASAVAIAVAASAASAGTVTDGTLAFPNFSGTGNFSDHYVINTEGGVEVALRAKIFKDPDDTKVIPVGDVYDIPLNSVFSFDYSVDPDVGGSDVSLAGVVASLTITNEGNGASFTFDPSTFDNATNPSLPGAYENSERASFGFLGLGYDPTKNDTFDVVLTLTGVPDTRGPIVAENIVNIGAGVPEPASWALMILGFGGVGAALRRPRKATVASA